jgi:hypothetical protein
MDSLQMPADMLMGVASLMAKGLSPGDVVPMGQSPGLQAGKEARTMVGRKDVSETFFTALPVTVSLS